MILHSNDTCLVSTIKALRTCGISSLAANDKTNPLTTQPAGIQHRTLCCFTRAHVTGKVVLPNCSTGQPLRSSVLTVNVTVFVSSLSSFHTSYTTVAVTDPRFAGFFSYLVKNTASLKHRVL